MYSVNLVTSYCRMQDHSYIWLYKNVDVVNIDDYDNEWKAVWETNLYKGHGNGQQPLIIN